MPFAVGNVAGGVDIEPYTTIMEYAPLCYWRMDEASGSLINSGSAASKNATVTNLTYSQTKVATRSPKTAIAFNGTTNTAEVAAGVIGGVNPTFSIGCFIRPPSSGANHGLICQRDGTNGNSGFDFILSSGAYLSFQGRTTSGVNDWAFFSEQIANIDDGNNHYVGATVTSNNVYLYLDGAMVGENGGRNGGIWSAVPKIFLGQQTGATALYNGVMSDAFITTQVLTQADHNRIWRAGMLHNTTPPNDNFLDAVEIPFPTTSTTLTGFDLSDNSIEPGEIGVYDEFYGYHPVINSGKTAWYKVTNTAAGNRIKFNGYGQTPYFSYHYLEVYKDTDGTMANLEYVMSALSYVTSASAITEDGATYYIRVRPMDFFPNVLDLTYEYITPPPPPANDDFADAQLLDVSIAGSVSGTLAGSTIEFPLETDNWTSETNSVWYKFVADATGNITFDTELTSPFNDMVLQGFEGDLTMAALEADPYLAPYYDNDTGPGGTVLMTMAVVSGNTYYIQASDFGTEAGFTIRWTDIV